uniref:Putative salivary kunitz domain protein n=1 Tax=Ixodes ricinus TaxID=34613 RepID=A0A0K8RMP1_IXORI
MEKNILWIFVAAVFEICYCDYDYDESRGDSLMAKKEGRCKLPLDLGSRGWDNVKGYFYDPRRDECRLVYFRNGDWDDEKNMFRTLSDCRRTCRGGVPSYCFKTPPKSPRKQSYPMVTYNSSQGECEEIPAQKNNPEANIFQRKEDCNNNCRDPELGQCAPSATGNCGGRESGISYRYNMGNQSCEKVVGGGCGPFKSLEDCSLRCGRYISNKCNMPALTSKFCDIKEARYRYNPVTEKCEEIEGCADDVTNFKTAADCWESCSSKELNRCLKHPDLGRLGFGRTHYYYNMRNNTCLPTTHFAFWQTTGKTNRFTSFGECERTCKPKHKGVVKEL